MAYISQAVAAAAVVQHIPVDRQCTAAAVAPVQPGVAGHRCMAAQEAHTRLTAVLQAAAAVLAGMSIRALAHAGSAA